MFLGFKRGERKKERSGEGMRDKAGVLIKTNIPAESYRDIWGGGLLRLVSALAVSSSQYCSYQWDRGVSLFTGPPCGTICLPSPTPGRKLALSARKRQLPKHAFFQCR